MRRALLGAFTVLAAFVWPGASNAATVTEYPLAAGTGPSRIVVGPDARLWFTDASSSDVGVIGLDGTLGGRFSVAASATPTGIVRGPDGNLWFVEKTNNAVGRITPTGTVTEFSLATLQANSGPLEIALGPNGLLYFTEANVDRIASINPLAGSDAMILASLMESTIVPSGSGAGAAGLRGITPGPDGRLWFTEATVDRVGNVTANLATINEYSTGISAASAPTGIAAGPDGALWFTESSGSRIGRIPTAGTPVGQFSLPTAGAGPTEIALGPDAALWFSENSADQIGRIDPVSHAVMEFPLAKGSGPQGIVAGPDGAVWFTEFGRDRIGRLSLTSSTPLPTTTPPTTTTIPPSTTTIPPITTPQPRPAPQLSAAKLSRTVFVAENQGASLAAKTKRGTDVSYRDSEAATTTFAVLKAVVGHEKGKRCAAGRPGKHQKRCTRYVSVGSFTHQDQSGNVKVHFTGRLGGHKLKPGRYILALRPEASGKSGPTVKLSFRIVA
jgi:streptogramin lyase